MDAREALRRGRQVIAVVADPKLRGLLVDGATGPVSDPRTQRALAGFDWLTTGGTVDVPLLRRTVDAIESLLSDRAILQFARVQELPADAQQRQELSVAVVRSAFERLGVQRGVSEDRLNAALAMLVQDPATVRRDAVDVGFLERTADGRSYALRQAESRVSG